MLLEDFEKAQLGGSVSPAGPGSVADLNATLQSEVVTDTVGVASAAPASTPSTSAGWIEDIKQRFQNPQDTIFNRMGAGMSEAVGGYLQKNAEDAQRVVEYAQQVGAQNPAAPVFKPQTSFAGIQAEDPTQVKQKLAESITVLKQRAAEGKDIYQFGADQLAALDEKYPQQSYLGTTLNGVTSSIGYMIPTMAATFIMPELAVPLTAQMYFTTAGQKYGERRNEEGFSARAASYSAEFQGGVEVATELSGSYFMGQFWKAAKAGKSVLKPFIREIISEYAGESFATALQGGDDAVAQKLGAQGYEFGSAEQQADAFTDYILSKQHLSDQLDTLVQTTLQSALMGIPGKIVQFDSKRRVKNYVDQLQGTIREMEANGEIALDMANGTVVGLGELRDEVKRLQENWGLDVKTQEQAALQSVDQSADVEEAESVLEEPAPEVDEEELLTSVKADLPLIQEMEAATTDEIMQDNEIFESQVTEEVTAEPALAPVIDPEFGERVAKHLAAPITEDNFVIASPAFQAQANFVEDILIATNTPVRVAILTVDDLRANGDLAPSFGALVEHMSSNDKAAVQRLPNGRYIVAVNPLYSDAQNLELITHEAVGHVIAFEQYGNADAATQAAIEADYQKFLNIGGSAARRDAMYPFSWAKSKETLPVDNKYITIKQEGTNVGKEWLANQITKWATTSEQPLTLADKWFRKLAVKLRAALGKLKRKGNTKALAAPSVEAWMNSLFDASRLDSIQNSNTNSVAVVEVTAKKELSYNKKVEKLKKLVKPEALKRFKTGKAIMDGRDEARAEQLRKEIKAITKTGHSSVAVERMKKELKTLESKYANSVTIYTTAANGQQIPLKTVSATSRTAAIRAAEYHKLLYAVADINLLEKRSNTSKRREYYTKLFTTAKDKLMAVAQVEGISAEQAWLDFLSNPLDRLLSNKIRTAVNRYGYDQAMDRALQSMELLAQNNPSLFRTLVLYEKRVIPQEVQEVAKVEEQINAELEATEPAVVEEVKKAKRVIVRKKAAKDAEVSVQNPNPISTGSVEELNAALQAEDTPAPISVERGFDQRVIEAAQDAVIRSVMAGDKPNMNRVLSATAAKLQLTGKDKKAAEELVKKNWADLSTGKTVEPEQHPMAGIGIPEEISDEEAAAFMEMLDGFAAAWHGGPHRFDKFSLKHIGSGEGAQVYGWGLYFASNRKVAEWYKNQLSRAKTVTTVKLDGKVLVKNGKYRQSIKERNSTFGEAGTGAIYELSKGPSVAQVLQKLKDRHTELSDKAVYDLAKMHVQHLADMINWIEENQDRISIEHKKAGALYQVELAPQEDEYLLWDESFERQPPKIKEALVQIFGSQELPPRPDHAFEELEAAIEKWRQDTTVKPESKYSEEDAHWVRTHIASAEKFMSRYGFTRQSASDIINYYFQYNTGRLENLTGRDIYNKLIEMSGSAVAASETLHLNGIRGNKYLDGMSRNKGEGNYNYVIFNDEDIDIVDISDFAKKKTPEEVKQQKIKDSLYLKPKATRKKKVLTPEEEAEKEAAKLERRSKAEKKRKELLEKVIQLAQVAKSKELSLTEYLSREGFSDEDALKMVRMYYANFGSVFGQREQIIRLSRELGLYLTAEQMLEDPDADVAEGLNELIKETFPKSYGTLDTLGIRGKDVILAKLQKLYEDQTGEPYDFSKAQTIRDFKEAKQKEFDSLSGWEKLKIAVRRVLDRVQDDLSVTPAGSKIVWYLKQIQSAQYSLYSRDYMRKIDEMMKEIPDASAREALTEKYLAGEEGSTDLDRKYLGLMNQIFTSYGMEMERLGFKIYYNSKRQEMFKFDPAERYFPRMWPDGSFTKPSEEMIQSLIRSGEAVDEANARKIINKLRRRYNRLHVPRFANMEMARETNMDGWIKDPAEVLRRYVASGARRMAVMRILGSTAEAKLVSLAAEHLRQSNVPEAMEDAVNAIQAVIGGNVAGAVKDTAVTWGVDEAQAYAVMTMLQHSVFLQPGVSANVSSITGYKNLVRGFSKIMFKDKATREINKARGFAMGVAERFIAKEMYDTIDGENNPARDRTDKILRSWRMLGLDQWMRAGTALASEVYLQEEIAKAVGDSAKAKKNLEELYIDAAKVIEAVETGNEEEVKEWIRMGSFTLTQKTNFATDALTMPKVLTNASPILQMLTLFSRFSYHQHKYISDMVRNHPARLARQIPSQLMVGAPIYMLRLLAKGVDPFKEMEEDGIFATLYKMFMSGSGLGLFAEMAISAFMGYTGKGGGPVGGTLTAGVQNIGQAARALSNDRDISEYTYIAAIRGLIDAGIYITARYAPAPIGIPVAAGVAMVAPAAERNLIPTEKQTETNWREDD